MASIAKVLKKPGPISVKAFSDAINGIWKPGAHRRWDRKPITIGLAISGGVDSMALAYLCSRWLSSSAHLDQGEPDPRVSKSFYSEIIPRTKLQAFVVDHGVRKGSDVEAEAVSKALSQLNICTRVLTIAWPGVATPVGQPNFESLARKYRFQVLGKACREQGIESLFLAHHEDDQAETVLMRMTQGHRGAGLTGMEPWSEIPECHGIHGVHQSGRVDLQPPPVQDSFQNEHLSLSSQSQVETDLKHLKIEHGGVQIYRPLLGFPKASLKATCQDKGIPWFEDHTNADPTLTARNTIRHIYNNHRLPSALSKESILSLSRSLHNKVATRNEAAEFWFSKCNISRFDDRAGTLSIRFPSSTSKDPRASTRVLDRNVATLLLRKVLMLVSPQENVHISSLHGAVSRIFPHLCEENDQLARSSFTVAGVKIHPPKPEDSCRQPLKQTWFLMRQPHSSLPSMRPLLSIAPASSPVDADEADGQWTLPWMLYDNRFWIRVRNPINATLLIRPFAEGDLKTCRQILMAQGKNQQFIQRLSRYAPADVRWTLPAIVVQDDRGRERVLALPTLDVSIEGNLKWEVRYKHVEFPF